MAAGSRQRKMRRENNKLPQAQTDNSTRAEEGDGEKRGEGGGDVRDLTHVIQL